MTFQQFILILQARYKAALTALLLTVGLTAGVSLWLPKEYQASTALVLDVKSPDPITGSMLQGLMSPGYMATQIDIINSDRVANTVVKVLKLDGSLSVKEQWMDATGGKGSMTDWLAKLLQKHLDVKPSRESNLITINYSGPEPDFAATVANAFAQAYIDVNLDLRLAPARQSSQFFEAQSRTARDRLENAQNALSDYQQRNGITSVDERLDYETAKLNETSSQLTSVQTQTTDSQSKRQSGKSDTLAEVMQSPLLNGLKGDISRAEATLSQNSVNLGKNHPQTLRAQTELATLKAQLAEETRKITSSIDTTYEVGKDRETKLKAALAAQKERVLTLNKQRDELTVLRHDVDAAQRALDTVTGRYAQSNVESQTNQTNIAVLNPAIAPPHAARPRVLLNVALSIFVGGLLGIGLALAMEMSHRRVRSGADLQEALELPLLGSIGSAAGILKAQAKAKGAVA